MALPSSPGLPWLRLLASISLSFPPTSGTPVAGAAWGELALSAYVPRQVGKSALLPWCQEALTLPWFPLQPPDVLTL